jgi:tetratricopeptide (TPR) repeat protein
MLYGRDVERSDINALLDGARQARGGVLVLRGSPGAGKSVLLEDAVTAAAGLDAFATHTGIASEQARVAHCRALLAEGETARGLFEEALTLHARSRRPFERARTELAYGEFLRRARRRVEARTHLQAALDRFEQLNARPWAERARLELRAAGRTARKRDPSTVLQLTPQEMQVARFVARGLHTR